MLSSGERLSGYGLGIIRSNVYRTGAIHSLVSRREDAHVTNDANVCGCLTGDKVYTAHSTGIDLLAGLSNGWGK